MLRTEQERRMVAQILKNHGFSAGWVLATDQTEDVFLVPPSELRDEDYREIVFELMDVLPGRKVGLGGLTATARTEPLF